MTDTKAALAKIDQANEALNEARRLITDLRIENINLTSMCRAAAKEIDDHWDAHCDPDGFGPASLVNRLKGLVKPSYYSGYLGRDIDKEIVDDLIRRHK